MWDPHSQCDIYMLERVQRRAARFVFNRYKRLDSVTEMCGLRWISLQDRRKTARLVMFKKIIEGKVAVSQPPIVPAPVRPRRCHPHQFRQIQTKTNYRQNAFYPRTIVDWNKLPEKAVAANTIEVFRTRVSVCV